MTKKKKWGKSVYLEELVVFEKVFLGLRFGCIIISRAEQKKMEEIIFLVESR